MRAAVLRDAARPDGEPVRIEAVIGGEPGQGAQRAILLQRGMVPYVDLQQPQPATVRSAALGGPKL